MVQLSSRQRNDFFWFAFTHEIGHLLLHSKKETAFISRARTPTDAAALAHELGIAPVIVAGRYQPETQSWSFGRGLFQKFDVVHN